MRFVGGIGYVWPFHLRLTYPLGLLQTATDSVILIPRGFLKRILPSWQFRIDDVVAEPVNTGIRFVTKKGNLEVGYFLTWRSQPPLDAIQALGIPIRDSGYSRHWIVSKKKRFEFVLWFIDVGALFVAGLRSQGLIQLPLWPSYELILAVNAVLALIVIPSVARKATRFAGARLDPSQIEGRDP